jgi:AcrR family transcriptional regulator
MRDGEACARTVNHGSLFAVNLRAQRRAAVRERILQAAHEQVAEGGYAAAGVAVLARRAGVATGSIYRYFPSKALLYTEVFRAAADRELAVVAEIAARRELTAAQRLATAVDAFCRRALDAPKLAFALMAEPVDPAVEVARLQNKRAYRDVFARLLVEARESGELRAGVDPHVAAAALVGALQEALIGPLAEGGGDALVASLIAFALSAVGFRELNVEQLNGHPAQARS